MPRRWPARRPPVVITPAPPAPHDAELSQYDRRAHAWRRIWPLLSTSIPTRDLVDSYLDEVLA